MDYVLPHLTVNGAVSLTSSPIIDIAATTGRADVFGGGQATFDSSKNEITAWTLGAGARVTRCTACCAWPRKVEAEAESRFQVPGHGCTRHWGRPEG